MKINKKECYHDFALYSDGKKLMEKCYYCGKTRKIKIYKRGD